MKTTTIKRYISITLSSASRIRSAWKPLWNILSFSAADKRISPRKNICLAIEQHGLSVGYGSGSIAGIKVQGTKRFPSGEHSYPHPKELASMAVLALEELGATGPEVTLSIPRAWTIIKTTEFPSTVMEEITNVIAYEFDRLMPLHPEEALYDFRVLKEDKDFGKIVLVIAAAKAETVNEYCDALREKGISVNRVGIGLSGIGALCGYIGTGNAPIFLGIDDDGYEGALYLDNVVYRTFGGRFRDAGETGAGEASRIETISQEILPFIDAVRQYGASPHIAVLTNDHNNNVAEALMSKTNLPVVRLDEKGKHLLMPGQADGISYAATGGVIESLSPKAKGFDLLTKGRREHVGTPVALTVLLLLSIVVLWIIYLVAPLSLERKNVEAIEQQIIARKGIVKEVDALGKRIKDVDSEVAAISGFKENRPMSINILRELTTILPKTAWLTRVRITGAAVEIEGYARAATELLSKLEASKYFGKAEFASPTFRDTRTQSDRFSIRMEIRNDGVKKEEPVGNTKK
ncbi:MAG: Fimbrial assembly protein (PilN) [Syntrophorhabdus sp. PtaU1.Bin058]|nr:MAG: Fimbrial assembly protein (PilN) [Syntrophorhabdus sp. PtaU1.Bin058]